MFQHLYDEWLTKLSEKAAHLSGLFPNIVVQEGAVEKPLRDYSVSEQAAILCAYGDLKEDDEGEEFLLKKIGSGTLQRSVCAQLYDYREEPHETSKTIIDRVQSGRRMCDFGRCPAFLAT